MGLGFAVAVTASFVSRSARAFECKVSEDHPYVGLHWNQRVLQYGVVAPGSKSVDALTTLGSIDDAFRVWSLPSCTDLRFESVGVVPSDSTDVNRVAFVQSNWQSDREAVAITRTTYGTVNGLIRNAVIEVNEVEFWFGDTTAACSADPATYDLEAVLTHEVGHLIGLDHTTLFNSEATDPTMAPQVGACEADKRSIELDDIEGLCRLYPRGAGSRACDPLPSQEEAYVGSRAFGCSARSPEPEPEPAFLGVLASIVLLRMATRRRPG